MGISEIFTAIFGILALGELIVFFTGYSQSAASATIYGMLAALFFVLTRADDELPNNRRINSTTNSQDKKKEEIKDPIYSVYPDFNEIIFTSSIKLSFDKLTNKSLSLAKSLSMVATDGFIKEHSDEMAFVKEINSDDITTTSSVKYMGFDSETKQIKICWKYKYKRFETNPKTGKPYKGLTRTISGTKYFNVIKAENVKFPKDVVHCPNCGAPLKYALALKCNQCNSSFDYKNYWLINELIEE